MQEVLQNRYQIKHLLGQGGMGTVYMGEDLHLSNRPCVIKQLRDDFYNDEDKQKALACFEREAGVLSRLEHPNIVHILDYFSESGKYFLVMEYVVGEDLHTSMQHRQGKPYSEGEVLNWSIEICEVLEYLHSQIPPVIYRDLKPSNIMLTVKGQIKLVDFGIARPAEEGSENTHVVSAGYSPPEQYWGGAIPQSDLYALGATMYFLLTGKDPEPLKSAACRLSNPEISEYVDSLIKKATAQDITQRYASVQELREALLHWGFEEAPDNIQSWFIRSVAAVVFLAALALVFLWEPIMNAFHSGKENIPLATTPPGANLKTNPDPLFGGVMPQKSFALQTADERSLTDLNGNK